MITWSWLIIAFLIGLFVGVGGILIPLMIKGMKKLGKN